MLTELEGAVLGAIDRRGSCTAYAVMKEFDNARFSSWSASSGAIYPSVRKLEAAGLIRAEPNGASSTLTLTNAGKKQLRRWISDLSEALAQVPADPIRTRVNFLGSLRSAEAKKEFLAMARDETKAAIHRLQALIATTPGGPWEQAGREGALRQLESRLSWLEELSRKPPRE